MLEIETTGNSRAGAARTGLIIAVALATGAIGFAVGRAADRDDSSRAVGAAPDPLNGADSNGADRTTATDAGQNDPAPTVATAPADTASGAATADSPSAEAAPSAGDMAMGAGTAGGGQYSANAYAEEPRELVAQRTTSTGVTMRAHLTRYDASMSPYGGFDTSGSGDGWTPAGWCSPGGDLRISIAAPDSANVTWAPWYTEPKDGVAVSSFSTGYVEGVPMFGVVVQVGADATSVTFTTASGANDTTTPSNGLALLIVAGPIEDGFTIDVDRPDDGSTSVDVAELTESWGSVEYREACEPPPPALPPAGEQPADVAAAEAAVHESWRMIHDSVNNEAAVRQSFIDDATGLAEAWEALQNGQYGDAARTSTTTIRELVFTTPTEAWFRYDIETSLADFPNRYGIARLSDGGTWQITRQTICQDISLAPGFGCTPSVDTLYPPSAVNDPRYGGVPTEGPPPGEEVVMID